MMNTPYYSFEDNSTFKPNPDMTIIRNPTLMNLGIGERLNKSHQAIKPMNLSKLEFEHDESP